MIEAQEENYNYLYGPNESKDLVIYVNLSLAHVPVSSLEGIFVAKESLTKNIQNISKTENLKLRREEMSYYERDFNGKFVPFKK